MGSYEQLASRVRGLLARIGEGADVHETLEEVLAAVGEASGCESVGIRWKAGEDYPYLLTRGFGREFVVVEGPLCVRDAAGLILRHRRGIGFEGAAILGTYAGVVALQVYLG